MSNVIEVEIMNSMAAIAIIHCIIQYLHQKAGQKYFSWLNNIV